jgi:hypothetical protein
VVAGIAVLELLLAHNERRGVLIARCTTSAGVWIAHADVYPAGVLLAVELRGRGPAPAGVEAALERGALVSSFVHGRKATAFGLGCCSSGAMSVRVP